MTYKCPKCNNYGWYEVKKDGHTFARECECGWLKRDRMATRLKFAEIPKEFCGQSIENFRTDCYSTKNGRELAEAAKCIATQYILQFPKISKTGKGLYFYSGVKGSGKTRLAVSIANDLMAQHMAVAKYATTIQILDQIKNTWSEKGKRWDRAGETSEKKMIDEIISAPVLVMDDIGVEQPKDWVKERFYNIINGRMIQKRITIFTSNCRINELNLDERIVNRIEKMALPVVFPAESIRSKIAKKENSELMDRLLGK